MNNKKIKLKFIVPAVAALFAVTGCASGSANHPLTDIPSNKSVHYDRLTISKGDHYFAPENHYLTMTSKGIEEAMKPGTYNDVTLTITGKKTVSYLDEVYPLRMGLYVNDGKIISDKSVLASLIGTKYDNSSATGGSIVSWDDCFNGIVIGGNTKYEIKNMTLNFLGNGGDDFAGYGAGIMVTDNADVKISNVDITTQGALRPGIFAAGNSTLYVCDSNITGLSVDESKEPEKASMLTEVPWVLGIKGNCRATNLLGAAHVTYERCKIKADQWGALSTDSCDKGATLTAKDCLIEITGDSGYATYADEGVFNTYENCTLKAPDYGMILAAHQCGAKFTGDNVIDSGRFGILWHKNQNGSVTLGKGTVINSGETSLLIKSDKSNTAYPNIVADGAQLNANNGIILHLMESDDPGMGGGKPGTSAMWASSYTIPKVVPVTDDNNISDPETKTTVHSEFEDMNITGNIYNSRWTAGQNLSTKFVNTTITGIISGAIQSPKNLKTGDKITRVNRKQLGEVSVVPHEIYSNGMLVSFDKSSVWNITGTSYLSYLQLDDGAAIIPPGGKKITMYVNGTPTEIKEGTYTGKITLEIK